MRWQPTRAHSQARHTSSEDLAECGQLSPHLGVQVAFVLPLSMPFLLLLLGGGVLIAMYLSGSFSVGAWYTAATLLVFAGVGRVIKQNEFPERQPFSSVSVQK